jgi:hypothetical protein
MNKYNTIKDLPDDKFKRLTGIFIEIHLTR